jgi:hypothetical protein
MMKYRINPPTGRPLLVIGLEAGNIERLKRGQPIMFPAEQLEMQGFDIAIQYGDTKEAMVAEMEAHGLTISEDMKRQIAEVGPERGLDA